MISSYQYGKYLQCTQTVRTLENCRTILTFENFYHVKMISSYPHTMQSASIDSVDSEEQGCVGKLSKYLH